MTRVENCTFNGVKWDAQATTAIRIVAEGLKENAIALGRMVDIFKSQNINIETMLTLSNVDGEDMEDIHPYPPAYPPKVTSDGV